MIKLLLVVAGGGLGSAMRYGVILLLPPANAGFPYATLLVNATGSLLVGMVAGLFANVAVINETWRLFIVIGVLSGFTTFSTFSFETMQYFLDGKYLVSIANVILNFVLCLTLVYLGFIFGKTFFINA